MKFFIPGILFVLLYASSLSPVSARAIVPPVPDDLAEQSTLVCNGLVESVSVTDDGMGAVFTAKIKVLHVFKGEALSEIKMRYGDSEALAFIPNGGSPVSLDQNRRYRFFLKKGSVAPYYVAAYEGMDKCFSVAALAPNEPDDAAFISKKEIWQIASKWLKHHHPELPPLLEYPDPHKPGSPPVKVPLPCQMICYEYYDKGRYRLTIYSLSKDQPDSSKELVILWDRTVDEQAWNKSS